MMRFWTVGFFVTMVFLVFACGEENNQKTPLNESEFGNAEFEINISNGSLLDGEEKLIVTKDENVRLIINSDKDVVVHLHGYDIEKIVNANHETYFDFHAHATGRFLVNVHVFLDEVKDDHNHSSHSNNKINSQKHNQDSHSSSEEFDNLLMTIEVHPQ